MLVLILPLFVLFRFPLHAQSTPDTSGPSLANSIATKVGTVPVVILWLGFHETGHYAFGKLFGAKDIRMGLFRRKPEGGVMVGWTDFGRSEFSPVGQFMSSMGGVIFSRGLAEGMDLLVEDVLADGTPRRLASVAFILGRFDFPRYVVQDALINMLGHRASDMDFAVSAIQARGTLVRTALYGALIALATLDLVNDWDRIAYHWDVAAGETPKRPASAFLLRPSVGPRGVGLAATASW